MKDAFRQYRVHLVGQTPMLMRNDNLVWTDMMKTWEKEPGNKKKSTAGDDRTPAWRWIGGLYIDGTVVCMPSDNIMTVIRNGAKLTPTGKKGGASFKASSQAGIVVDQASWPLLINGKTIPWSAIEPLTQEEDFKKHEEAAVKLGFVLYTKRVAVGQTKHVRVRPRFDVWTLIGTLTVLDENITTDVLRNIWTQAGFYSGFGDWRPSAPKSPGSWGKFTAQLEQNA